MGVIVRSYNPLNSRHDKEVFKLDSELSINDWLDQNKVTFSAPTICLKNGEALLRADWDQTIGQNDIVAFVELPQGGKGGSNILQVLLMVVVAIAAAFTGGVVAAAYGTVAGAVAGAAVGIVGNFLVSLIVPAGNGLSNLQSQDAAAASPTYNLQAQGNSARIGAPIPVIYGKHRVYPDYAAMPYTEYKDNEQYLYMLLCIGQGDYDILDMRIEDTPISSFEEVSYTIYGPGATVTSFPTRVEVSGEVSGQELIYNNYVGPFFVNAEDTEINKIGVDIVAPYGMYYANDLGKMDTRSATFHIEAALWNPSTGAFGPFIVYLTRTIGGASPTAIRKSYSFDVAKGRYAVRVKRVSADDTSARAGDTIIWAGMRGYVPGVQNYGNITTLAVIAKATNNLSSTSSRRINCLVQRRLKTWSPTQGWSNTATPSRSIAWAIADAAKADYGLKLVDSQIDLQGLFDLDQYYASREALFGTGKGDYCDIVFDNKISALEALGAIAQCGRAIVITQGSLIRVIRDTQQALHTAMFCTRNIVKGSFSVKYLMPNGQSADSVIVEWINKDTLMPMETLAVLPGETSANPARVKIQGISHEAQAWREGITHAAANRYRRKVITFQTELEGHIPTVGDLIAISYPMVNWGISGELVDFGMDELTLSEPVNAEAGSLILLRKPDGSTAGPFECEPHISGDPYKITFTSIPSLTPLPTFLGFDPVVTDEKERTYFAIGKAQEIYISARVLPPIRPRGLNLVEITCTNEAIEVHQAETGTVPALPEPWQLPKKITKPVITRLDVTHAGTAENPALLLSWNPAAGADHYIIQSSANNIDWVTHPDTASTSTNIRVEPGPVWVRVAGVGLARGDWATWSGTAGLIPPPGDVTGLASVEPFTGSKAKIKWLPVTRATSYTVEVWAAGVQRRSISTAATAFEYTDEDVKKDGGPWRSLTFMVSASNGQGSSVNKAQITMSNPQIGALSGVSFFAGIKMAVITYTRPSETDWDGVLVWMSQTSGFTPSGTEPGTGNCIYAGKDQTITIPSLVENVPHYFVLAAYDSFGRDSLNFTAEYTATVSSINAMTPDEIKTGLQQALDNASSPLVFNAEAFAVNINGIEKPPFIIGSLNGNAAVLLDADVGITGSVSASQLKTGRMAATENLTIGNGNAVINGNGSMIVYKDGDSVANRDYALLTGGNLTFQRFRGGQYRESKSVRRIELGQANSGQTVLIDGYWDSQPTIMVSPASLQSYNAAQNQSSQTWSIRAQNLHETAPGSGQWQFDAIAELDYAANAGNITVASNSGALNVDGWYSAESILPANTATVTVAVQVSSVRGDGISTHGYFYRSVDWYILGWNGTGWDWLIGKTINISAADHGQIVVDTNSVNMGGRTKILLYFVARDTDSTKYSRGIDEYNYSQATVPVSPTTNMTVTNDNQYTTVTKVLHMPVWTVDPNWENYATRYMATWNQDEFYSDATMKVFANGIQVVSTSDRSNTRSGSYDSGVSNGAYNRDFWSIRIVSGQQYGAGDFTLTPTSTTAYLRQKLLNSAAAQNNYTFQSYSWAVSGSSSIAQGSMNWVAIGD